MGFSPAACSHPGSLPPSARPPPSGDKAGTKMRFFTGSFPAALPRQPQTFRLPTQFRAPPWGPGTPLPTAQEGPGPGPSDFSIPPNLQGAELLGCDGFPGLHFTPRPRPCYGETSVLVCTVLCGPSSS